MEQTASTYWKGINNQSQTSEKEFVLQYIDWAGCLQLYVYFHGWTAPSGPRPPHCPGFTITLRLWTRNETDAETSTWQFTTCTRDIHFFGGIWTCNPNKLAAADLCLRPLGSAETIPWGPLIWQCKKWSVYAGSHVACTCKCYHQMEVYAQQCTCISCVLLHRWLYLEMEICEVEQYLYIKIAVFLPEMHGSAMESYVNHWVIMSYHIEQFQGGRQHSE